MVFQELDSEGITYAELMKWAPIVFPKLKYYIRKDLERHSLGKLPQRTSALIWLQSIYYYLDGAIPLEQDEALDQIDTMVKNFLLPETTGEVTLLIRRFYSFLAGEEEISELFHSKVVCSLKNN